MHGPLFLRPCTDFVGHAISGYGPPHTHPYTPRSGSCTQQIVWDALASQPGPPSCNRHTGIVTTRSSLTWGEFEDASQAARCIVLVSSSCVSSS